jgi:hypothetical protein
MHGRTKRRQHLSPTETWRTVSRVLPLKFVCSFHIDRRSMTKHISPVSAGAHINRIIQNSMME